MNPYEDFIRKYIKLVKQSEKISSAGLIRQNGYAIKENAPKVLVFSPHPDDECIAGALPLRLLDEVGMRVINVPVTLGSDIQRKENRRKELLDSCNYLGFDVLFIRENGLSNIHPKESSNNTVNWNSAVNDIAKIIRNEKPRIIVIPHDREFNQTHKGTNMLVKESLDKQSRNFKCIVVEWEYWTPITNPNLLFEVDEVNLSKLLIGLGYHVSELERNLSYVKYMAWLQDNVRRGKELISTKPEFTFGVLYRVGEFRDKRYFSWRKKQYVRSQDDISSFFGSE